MFLIASGAYIEQEFISEIGMLPPSFLPLGNRCLFEHQVSLVGEEREGVFLSIPMSFEISKLEKDIIDASNIKLVPVPDGLSLGQSILYCINRLSCSDETLKILHGDTLFRRLPAGSDLLTISLNTGYYKRGVQSGNVNREILETRIALDNELVSSGYFSFSDATLFAKLLDQCQGDFIKAINAYHRIYQLAAVIAEDWYDFGHINAYFNSRAAFTTERSFNTLEISPNTVKKSSKLHHKMHGEVNWFTNLPEKLQTYTPKLIEIQRSNDYEQLVCGYTLEYIYNYPLSDLFVFGRHKKETWRSIFIACRRFLDLCVEVEPRTIEIFQRDSINDKIYLNKTLERLEHFSQLRSFDLDQEITLNGMKYSSIREIAEKSAQMISPTSETDISIIHGDFCFSNILYDFRTRQIKVIDPRGIDYNGKATILGDRRYDLAKLYHSVIGRYDLIIAGRLKATGNFIKNELDCSDERAYIGITEVFDEIFFENQIGLKQEIHAITIHLFLSMLPYHNDNPDRQKTMLANAVRLYAEIKRG